MKMKKMLFILILFLFLFFVKDLKIANADLMDCRIYVDGACNDVNYLIYEPIMEEIVQTGEQAIQQTRVEAQGIPTEFISLVFQFFSIVILFILLIVLLESVLESH